MNILLDQLPKKILIDNIEYGINADFRNSILFELMMQDPELTQKQKIIQALEIYYPIIPENINFAIEKILWFYQCGKDIEESKNKKINGKSVNIYNFEIDSDYIFAAFLDQYNIDLNEIVFLHWWKFKAMFSSLKKDNEIVKIMGYRSMDLSKIKDKNQRAYYKKMQDMYKIKSQISKENKEKEKIIQQALLNGEDISKLL